MNQHQHEQIEKLLEAKERHEPPVELLDKIKGEIPEYLTPVVRNDETSGTAKRPVWTWRRTQLVAASLFVVVIGGIVANRVLLEEPAVVSVAQTPATEVERTEERARVGEEAPETVPGTFRTDDGSATGADRKSEELEETLAELRSKTPGERQLGTQHEANLREQTARNERRGGTLESEPLYLERSAKTVEPEETTVSTELDAVGKSTQFEAQRKLDERTNLPRKREAVRTQTPQSVISSDEEVTIRFGIPDGPPSKTAEGQEQGEARIISGQMDPAIDGAKDRNAVRPNRGRMVILDDQASQPSTGGTTEPNDRPYGDVFFDPTGVNPFVDTEDDNLSTFGLDVDTGSYTVARRYLRDGHLPPAEAIRVEEFVNYFDYGDRAPRREDFAVRIEGAPSPFAEGPRYQLLRFGIKAREVTVRERRPATLVFVVDTSGSMERGGRLELVKRALQMLLDELGKEDRVGLVEYGSHGRILLEPTRDKYEVERALRRLTPHGSTNAEEGLVLGYELADEYFRRNAINRVILCSDGVANVGRTGPESILGRIEREARRGIEITTVGFGMGNYNDTLMEQLADRGDGRYAYVDTLDEAHRIFVEDLTGTLQTVAREAKVQVEFNPAVVSRYRLLGYENRDIADHRFRDNSVDAGEIGAGHAVTALYEVKLHEDAPRRAELATLHLRWESPETGRAREIDEIFRADELASRWRETSPALQLAAVVAEFAEILKESYWAKDSSLANLLERSKDMEDEFDRDPDISELSDLIGEAARLGRHLRE